jgi:hypothetical protein
MFEQKGILKMQEPTDIGNWMCGGVVLECEVVDQL